MSKWHWLLPRNRRNDVPGSLCLEWHVSRYHLVNHHTQTEDVCSMIDGLSSRLLWRHVTDCSHYACIRVCPGYRCRGVDPFTRLLLSQLSKTKVQHFDIAVPPDHHVFGLNVAVHNARFMRRH